MSRHVLLIDTEAARAKAQEGVRCAPLGYVLELREAKRSDEQNRALHGLINQILKQRPIHRGHKMTMESYKAGFLQALGREMEFVPSLDGNGYFPMGHRSSVLTKREFSDLLECIIAWAVQEGLTVDHFDEAAAA